MKTKLLLTIGILFTLTVSAQELITTNRSFQTPHQDWKYGAWGSPKDGGKPEVIFDFDTKSGRTDSNSFRARVKQNTKDGAGNKASLRRRELKLKKGKEYTLSLWVKSRFIEDKVFLSIYSSTETGGKYPWGAIFSEKFDFKSAGDWVNITHTFIAEGKKGKKVDFKNMNLVIGFDNRKGTYWIDDVSLKMN